MRTFDESTRSISVEAGEAFTLALRATAGYTWQAAVDERFLVLEEQRFEPPQASVLGAAGRECLVFRAQRTGRCRLELAYRRSWEAEPHTRRVFPVEIGGQPRG